MKVYREPPHLKMLCNVILIVTVTERGSIPSCIVPAHESSELSLQRFQVCLLGLAQVHFVVCPCLAKSVDVLKYHCCYNNRP